MVRSLIYITILISTLITALGAISIARAGSTNVVDLNIDRYLGRWYEIARLENPFERDLTCVTAHYTMQDNGQIEVVNRGYNTTTKEWSEARGRAKLTDESGRLRVSFFWIFFSDYNVLAVDDRCANYEWALVSGGRGGKYLWILARTPSLNSDTLAYIERVAMARGYDIESLIYLDHSCDSTN
ncbi:MAG: lipocalin family protein [Rikenellaceae bacterium]